jgi:hypothetical protein
MSELNETFKRAILTFTHADEFVVSLYEGAYTIAEGISERIAEERNFYKLPVDKQIEIENEIGAAVAFSNKILPALFLMQMSFLEDWLLEICQVAAGQEDIAYDFEGSGRFVIEHFKTFFEKKLLVTFPDPWPAWEKLMELHRLREYAVHHTGLEVGQVRLSDGFLVEVNGTIISFLKELMTLIETGGYYA